VSVPDFDTQDFDLRDLDFGGGVVTEGGGVGIEALLKVGEGDGDLMSMKGAGEFRHSFLPLMGANMSSSLKMRFSGLLCVGGGIRG
jgi:hypothetical protein